MANKQKQVKVSAITYAQLIKHMFEGIYSCQELAEITGLHYVTVLQYTRELHAAKAAHICSLEQDGLGRHNVKIYKLGPGKDVDREALRKHGRYSRGKQAQIELMQRMAG